MSDIPKSRQSVSKLNVVHKAYAIRRRIMTELMLTFGYSEKKFDEHIRKMTKGIRDPNERRERQEALREVEDNFNMWIIRKERDDILKYAKGIVNHLVAADTIYPTYMSEFEERRLELDRAMVCCNDLQQELEYIANILPADKNKYMGIVLEIQSEFKMIKALRQSDNRFLKHLKN